jgi:uncharacterized protein
VARKRIGLTLRLDDEIGGKKDTKGASRDDSRTSSKGYSPRKPAPQSSGGALADALRRASEKDDRGKGRP